MRRIRTHGERACNGNGLERGRNGNRRQPLDDLPRLEGRADQREQDRYRSDRGRALFRVFPPLSQQGAPDATHPHARGDASASADDARRAEALERENKLLREALEDLRKALALADRLSLAAPIAAQGPVASPEAAAPSNPAPEPRRRSWAFWRKAG